MITKSENEILLALEGSSPESPKELWELVYEIDYRQREIPSYDEILTVIETMIENGDIKETKKLRYFKTQENKTKGPFTRFSESEYLDAVEKYREWVAEEWERADDIPMERIIVIELSSKDLENEELFTEFSSYLADSIVQELIGIPIGIRHFKSNRAIEITSVENVDANQVYEYVLPLIDDIVKKHGGTIKVTVGRKGTSKSVYVLQD